jgi:glucoamylase
VWAHSEHLKLLRSLSDGCIFDMPPQPVERYQVQKVGSLHAIWRFNHKVRIMPAGAILRVEVLAPATVHWTSDGWQTVYDAKTQDTGLGVHFADLATGLASAKSILFTFFCPEANRWEEMDFEVGVQ